jgi:hypothetical protein
MRRLTNISIVLCGAAGRPLFRSKNTVHAIQVAIKLDDTLRKPRTHRKFLRTLETSWPECFMSEPLQSRQGRRKVAGRRKPPDQGPTTTIFRALEVPGRCGWFAPPGLMKDAMGARVPGVVTLG